MELRTPLERKKSSRKLKSALSNDDHGWTAEEDDLLRAGICDYGGKKWKSIAENIERWSPEQCKRRWNQLQSVGDITKRPWTPEEDKQMIALINAAGACKWAVIASYLPGRNGKQCRESAGKAGEFAANGSKDQSAEESSIMQE
ncbi:hypothetical protein PHYBOEH_002848 [Phytophthora boehmeriae]|uniref:Myb-like DNA-binding protein n=1 Tax=Phytophthora boehmeriae TaxID=109152 RepID=A0A8T1WRF0_9STRA|nr:hypothetical protein PHYBOEH_002848 [Phytophthora boehmeriae]